MSAINLRHLRAFLAVAEHLHFTKAAEAVYLTQPALSALIRTLETDLGVRLLERNTRVVELTPIGREFYKTVQKLLAEFDEAVDGVRDYRAIKRGRVTIAALPSLCATILPKLTLKFGELYPDIVTALIDVPGKDILASLRDRTVDFAISYSQPLSDIRLQPLMQDRLVLICHRRSPLADSRSVHWSSLRDRPLVAMATGTTIRSLMDGVAAMQGIALNIAVEPHQMATALACVEAGFGDAVLPSSGVPTHLPPTLRRRNLVNPILHRDISILTLADYTLSPAAAAFRDLLVSELRRERG